MTPEAARQSRTARRTETAILEAARDLLAEGGLEGLSMRGVASRVGLSATAIYNYFDSKQDLVDRVVVSGFRRFEGYLESAIEGLPEGSPDRLFKLGEAYIRFALENREYFKVLFTLAAERPREIEELPAEGGYQLLRQAVMDAMDAGRIRRDDPDLVALYLWTHVHGLVTLFLACRLEGHCGPEGQPLGEESVGATELFARFRTFIREGLRSPGPAVDGPGTAGGGAPRSGDGSASVGDVTEAAGDGAA